MFTRYLAWGICLAWLAMAEAEAEAADKRFTIGLGAALASVEGRTHTERPERVIVERAFANGCRSVSVADIYRGCR